MTKKAFGRKPAPDLPTELKFGYYAAIEKDQIRHQLIREGHPDIPGLIFEINRRYDLAHADDPSYAEISKAWGANQLARAQQTVCPLLTADQAQFLLEHFQMANDQMGKSIYESVRTVCRNLNLRIGSDAEDISEATIQDIDEGCYDEDFDEQV